MVLFVPSMVRDGETPIDQERWLDLSLEMFGRVGEMTSGVAFS